MGTTLESLDQVIFERIAEPPGECKVSFCHPGGTSFPSQEKSLEYA
jgi:hypothetical protein